MKICFIIFLNLMILTQLQLGDWLSVFSQKKFIDQVGVEKSYPCEGHGCGCDALTCLTDCCCTGLKLAWKKPNHIPLQRIPQQVYEVVQEEIDESLCCEEGMEKESKVSSKIDVREQQLCQRKKHTSPFLVTGQMRFLFFVVWQKITVPQHVQKFSAQKKPERAHDLQSIDLLIEDPPPKDC